ncbi:MAG: hypothetical protein OEW11_07260 [Nitrospirota bacterium]|nr:hypothetical protein [Nitrospirota bacterium]
MEVMFAGFRHAAVAGNDVTHARKVSINNMVPATYNPNGTLASPAYWDSVDTAAHGTDPDWDRWETATVRAAAAGDFDLDGRDEFAILYFDSVTGWIVLRVVDDQLAGFAVHEQNLIAANSVTGIGAAAADTNGDARDDLIVGVTVNGAYTLYRYRIGAMADFTLYNSIRLFPTLTVADSWDWRITAGNLDLDPSEEFAVVINQAKGTGGASDYFVFDDEASGLALRDFGETSFSWPGHAERVVASDVAIADVDGNGVGNLVIGGINGFNTHCSNLPDYVVAVFDLGATGLTQLAATLGTPTYSVNTRCNNAYPFHIHSAWTHVVDMEGKGTQNIVVNQMVFKADISRWNADPNTWTGRTDVDHEFAEEFLPNSGLFRGYYMRSNTAAVAAADVTGNGKDNIVLYHRLQRFDNGAYYPEVRVLEFDSAGTPRFRIASRWNVDSRTSTPPMGAPLIVPADVDDDGMVMTPVSHELVYTNPLIQAVLAAPPCKYGIGQNVDACSTSFGQGSSVAYGREGDTTVKASMVWGWDIEVGVSWIPGAKVGNKAKISAELGMNFMSSHSYTVEKSITYESGPMEDTVVFTTVPYDRYTYEILSHPDPAMVGTHSFVMLPREPITLQTEVWYYNQQVESGGGAVIDETVLPHTIGHPDTYYTVARRDALLAQNNPGLNLADLTSNSVGMVNGPHWVNEGGGTATATLDTVDERMRGVGIVVGASYEIEFTGGGVLAGYSVGVEHNDNLTRTTGKSTSYSGSVGHIDAANHTQNRYQFGLFTYLHHYPSGEEFTVINYWVE